MALLALWSAVGLVFWVQTYHTISPRSASYGWSDAFADTFRTWLIWLAIAPLIDAFDRRVLTGRPLVQRLLGHALFSVPVTGLYVAISLGVDRLRAFDATFTWDDRIWDRFQWHLTNYWVLAGLLLLLSLDRVVARQRAEVSDLGHRLAEARLRSLSNQVRPHFLFNSLNTVAAVLEREPQQARRLLAELAENLRFALERTGEGGADLIPLPEELALVERTLSLEQARLGDRLSIQRRIEGETDQLSVPPFAIQILVENAIRHAVEPRTEPTRVELNVRAANDRLRVEVLDEGPGLTARDTVGSNGSQGGGIGLENLRHRLEVLFGEGARLTVASRAEGVGARAVMELPAVRTRVAEVPETVGAGEEAASGR